jgi:hypothetical protein
MYHGKLYIIEQIDFDNFENHDAIYSKVIGYVSTNSQLHDVLSKLDKQEKYSGYDGNKYPKFRSTLVDDLTMTK